MRVRALTTESSPRLESLRNMTERYDGYGNSIQPGDGATAAVKTGLLGVVADLIRVEIRYETAGETALGGSIQNIVTIERGDSQADDCLSETSINSVGATFLPLTQIRSRGSESLQPEAFWNEDGVIGLADTSG